MSHKNLFRLVVLCFFSLTFFVGHSHEKTSWSSTSNNQLIDDFNIQSFERLNRLLLMSPNISTPFFRNSISRSRCLDNW